MAFPSSPSNGDFYKNFKYNSTIGAWEKATGWHILSQADRDADWNPNGINISYNSWTRIDYSSKVPSSATILNISVHAGEVTGANPGLLNVKLPSETYAPGNAPGTHPECEFVRIAEQLTYNFQVPCENGQFDISEYGDSWGFNAIYIQLKGFYIGG